MSFSDSIYQYSLPAPSSTMMQDQQQIFFFYMMTRRTFNFTCRQGASTGTFLTKKSIVCEMTSVVTQAIVNLYRTATVIVKSANLRKQNNKVKELCWYTQYDMNIRVGRNWLKIMSSGRQWYQR